MALNFWGAVEAALLEWLREKRSSCSEIPISHAILQEKDLFWAILVNLKKIPRDT